MADIHEPQARKGIFERNKWILFVLTSCLMVFTTLWLIFVHVNHEGLLYPHDKSLKRIPYHWLHRAIAYNSFDAKSINYTLDLPESSSDTKQVSNYKLVCYYNFPPSLNTFRRLQPTNIEPNLCTHINLAFGSVFNNTILITEEQLKVASDIVKLKYSNKDLKVLLSIGGAGNGNGFPEMVLNHENRKTVDFESNIYLTSISFLSGEARAGDAVKYLNTDGAFDPKNRKMESFCILKYFSFIKSILSLVRDLKFDGIDLDWEFPEENVAPDGKQRMHFTMLLREIRNEVNRQEKHRFLLTVAVAAPVFIIDNSYDVTYLNDYVDFINVMTYDYHFYTRFTPFTGMNSPLYASKMDGGYFSTLNINYTVNYWLSKGMSKEKMVIGLPTYGHSFRLVNPFNNAIGAPANGYGSLGLNGFASYNEICMFLTKNQIIPAFDLPTRSAYATRNHEWISFDDMQSLSFKAEYIKDNNFAGAMVYALNTDDHQGICGAKRFPLTNLIKTTFASKEL